MGCLQRWAENEGEFIVSNFLRSANMKSQQLVVVEHDCTTYEFPVPNSVSEIDLIINETFDMTHGREPNEDEVNEIFSLLGKKLEPESTENKPTPSNIEVFRG